MGQCLGPGAITAVAWVRLPVWAVKAELFFHTTVYVNVAQRWSQWLLKCKQPSLDFALFELSEHTKMARNYDHGVLNQFVRVSTHEVSIPDWLLLATRIKHAICLFTYKSLALDRRWVPLPCLRLDLYTVRLQEDRCLSFLAEISAYL